MKKILLAMFTLAIWAGNAFAGAEYVTLIKVLKDDDQGIIERSNGERWLIEKGVGALSFWRFEGKKIIISSPGIFCGVGSKVILPDIDQEARIWSAEQINGAGGASATTKQIPDSDITAAALTDLGYFDPKNLDKQKSDLVQAMKAFQKASGIAQTGKMSPESQLALSKAISARKPVTESSLQLASMLLESGRRLLAPMPAPANPGGAAAVKIESRIDGDFEGWEGETVVKLINGQVWQQSEFTFRYHYAFSPKVVILKTATGYKMLVDGVSKAVGVTQLK